MTSRILALVGSLRAGSYNRQLAEAAVKYAPEGTDVEIFEGLGEVPFYEGDLDRPGTFPARCRRCVPPLAAPMRCYWSPRNTTAA